MSCGCPSGWSFFDKSCYLKVNNRVSHQTALDNCKNLGGQLVILNSKNEENYLSSVFSTNNGNYFWVGADVYAARNLNWFEDSSFNLPWCPSDKILYDIFLFEYNQF